MDVVEGNSLVNIDKNAKRFQLYFGNYSLLNNTSERIVQPIKLIVHLSFRLTNAHATKAHILFLAEGHLTYLCLDKRILWELTQKFWIIKLFFGYI